MEANPYRWTSLNDIIFEGRNKAYGAYQLRQLYHYNLFKAVVLSAAMVMVLLGIYYHAIMQNSPLVKPTSIQVSGRIDLLNQDLIFEPVKREPVTPDPPAPLQKTPTRQFREPRIVTDKTPVTSTIPAQSDFTQAIPGLENGVGELNTDDAPAEVSSKSDNGAEELPITEPFHFVEIMPEYAQGGQAGMLKFIYKHLRFPTVAQEQGLSVMVIVSFVVSPTGEITGIQVVRDIGGGAGEEAVRVISKMPKWKPGIQNQRPVPVRMTLPIRFKLN